jgi:hypothetical protein
MATGETADLSKACPFCGEKISAAAKNCKHCGEPSTRLPGRVIGGGSLLFCVGLLALWLALDLRGRPEEVVIVDDNGKPLLVGDNGQPLVVPLLSFRPVLYFGLGCVSVGVLLLVTGWWWLHRRLRHGAANRAALAGALLGVGGFLPGVLWQRSWLGSLQALGLALTALAVVLTWYLWRKPAKAEAPD